MEDMTGHTATSARRAGTAKLILAVLALVFVFVFVLATGCGPESRQGIGRSSTDGGRELGSASRVSEAEDSSSVDSTGPAGSESEAAARAPQAGSGSGASDPLPGSSDIVVVIDPGHQAKANLELEPIGPGSVQRKEKVRGGATGTTSRVPEHVVTLRIALLVKNKLQSAGVSVVMTRERADVNLSNRERAEIANKARAGLFLRIHADGSTNAALQGISVLYPGSNAWTAPIRDGSLRAARLIKSTTVAATGRPDRGLVARSDLTGFNWSKVPAILIEVGFLSNPEEDRLLNQASFQDKLATGIAAGVVDYLRTK